MAAEPSFAEILVSRLGTPPAPFEFTDLLILAGCLAIVVAWIALELALGRVAARLWKRFTAFVDPKPPQL